MKLKKVKNIKANQILIKANNVLIGCLIMNFKRRVKRPSVLTAFKAAYDCNRTSNTEERIVNTPNHNCLTPLKKPRT
ncbi:hypothetical protein CWB71_17720 [Pseudoalteromonas sp. S983]|nr:hypothetical protein CWB71_17720 [Pseudoalteromonas sp. S983]